MTPSERLSEARGMRMLGDKLEAQGILTAAGEMHWGALNHISIAIAVHHGLNGNNGKPKKSRFVMRYLQNVNPRTPSLENSFQVVADLHGHFYNKHMSDAQHRTAMAASRDLIAYLLNRPEVQVIP